jgi:hypothetical protein
VSDLDKLLKQYNQSAVKVEHIKQANLAEQMYFSSRPVMVEEIPSRIYCDQIAFLLSVIDLISLP